ncbi:hypothetical protein DICPUDRAFT_83769 [Dictyostelium purpureum]|uniref:Non-structural maintenance of chromosomes element 1 homolog n=1 Tax=Dictyostelium purpureum TaxID=5786 RepID=F1A0K1_DICPU|nr:uncharacterized protein DICPUDRAFT_83769 [Dictyostelium purpureum]EGC30268.1 hypothetical protein DICPUDRAFT_83769 [Dictyostelium purpureum]|eukprot:XP_003293195.1 hypothetical protein DICPUDRAFT_83769 [Dictyostelium purpureum]
MSRYGNHGVVDNDIEYGNAHIALLQQFIKCRYIQGKVLTAMVNEINRIHHHKYTPIEYVNTINQYIADYSMKIRQIKNNESFDFAIVNLKSDELSKLASNYSNEAISFFRNIFNKILESKGGIKRSEAFELSRGLKINDPDLQLQSFIEDGWFRFSESRYLTFSNRALMDLEPLLRDLNECSLCHSKLLIVKDEFIKCPNNECDTLMHNYCARRWFESHKNICPNCKNRI